MKILNPKNILKFILTLFNVLKIFIISFSKFQKNKSTKFIFFYFPVKAYQENIVDLVNLLNKQRNTFTFIIYNSFTSMELNRKKNSLFIDLGYLRFIPFFCQIQKIYILVMIFMTHQWLIKK